MSLQISQFLLSLHPDLIKKTKRYMRHAYIRSDTVACIHLIQLKLFFSLSKLSFHGNIQIILFIHVHNFEEQDMKRYINSLSL